MTAGLIVAGGRSTRFGETDKAVAELAGRPLIAHVASGLEASVDQLLVSCRREQQATLSEALSPSSVPVSFVADDREVGPLGGIHDGLMASDSEWTLVVGCDFPFVDERVVEALSPDNVADVTDAVVFQYPNGSVQPLCARYRTEPVGAETGRLLAAGEYRARELLRSVSTRYVSATDDGLQSRLENINTPAALAAAESRLADGESE